MPVKFVENIKYALTKEICWGMIILGVDMENGFWGIKNILNITVDNLLNFIHSNEKYTSNIVKLDKDYNIESNINFNIFTAFSDYYYKENLHSDIIKYIFDPHTEKVGNRKYMEIFKSFVENKLGKKVNFDLNSIKIEREKNKIDILIKDDLNNCIFIENKINNAIDMDDQIGRYYNILLKKNYSIQAVIYLKLSPLKWLDKNYSMKDPVMRNKIEKILLELPIVNKTGEYNFVDDVLNNCIMVSNNIVSTVFLTEYSSLLKYLGGNFMATELNIQAMYKIFDDEETLNSFRVFGSLWDNRNKIIAEVFKNYMQNQLGFLVHSGDANNAVFKKIKDDVNIGFHTDFSFGFVHTPDKNQINSSSRKLFKEILENENIQKYFTEDEVDDNGWWVYKAVDYNKITCLNDLKKLVEEFEKILEEKM
jgi:hypothetical protein